MTLARFTQIWNEVAPDLVFECSPRLQVALEAAAEGDFTSFPMNTHQHPSAQSNVYALRLECL
jgi:hypothetical protein